jgi:Subtilase family
MAVEPPDRYLRPDHVYPAPDSMPEGAALYDADGGWFLYRSSELLVAAEDRERVLPELAQRELLPRNDQPWRPVEGTSWGVVPVRDGTDVIAVLRDLQAPREGEPPLRVAPHHLVAVAHHASWSPGLPPTPPDPADRTLAELSVSGEKLPGAGVRVGVLDTGLDDDAGWLTGRFVASGAAIAEDRDLAPGPGLDFEAGHGTFITGIVLQHAPGAEVVVRRLGDDRGCISDAVAAAHIRAMVWDDGVQVLNLSFGGYTQDNVPLPAVAEVLHEALQRRSDLVVVAAAGNGGTDRPFWPAAMKRVIAVGALDAEDQRAPFSNYGYHVDAWSLGVDLFSTFLAHDGDLDAPPAWNPPTAAQAKLLTGKAFQGYAVWSGTSFAAPRVAAAVAAELSTGRSAADVVYGLVHDPATGPRTAFDGAVIVTPPSL